MECCELCKLPARVYCAADEARLCWPCDAYVHGANFLVSRHFRSLLCHACGWLTERLKTGVYIDPTLALCQRCCDGRLHRGDEESQISHSSSSTTSCSSHNFALICNRQNSRPKRPSEEVKEGSKRKRTDICAVQPVQMLRKITIDVELSTPDEMYCKECTPVARSADETDHEEEWELHDPQDSSKGEQWGTGSNTCGTAQRSLKDGCDTEDCESSVNRSMKCKARAIVQRRTRTVGERNSPQGSSSSSLTTSRKR